MKMPVWCLTPCILGSALAQDVPPPPKPADNGPSLAETMAYIQDKLNTQGKMEWQELPKTNAKNNFVINVSQEVSGAEASASKCALSWNFSGVVSPATPAISTEEFSFREVDHVEVSAWPPRLDHYLSPAVYLTKVVMIPGKKVHIQLYGAKIEDPEFTFPFRNEEAANRMAKAMVHAVELCKGDDKDPFK